MNKITKLPVYSFPEKMTQHSFIRNGHFLTAILTESSELISWTAFFVCLFQLWFEEINLSLVAWKFRLLTYCFSGFTLSGYYRLLYFFSSSLTSVERSYFFKLLDIVYILLGCVFKIDLKLKLLWNCLEPKEKGENFYCWQWDLGLCFTEL